MIPALSRLRAALRPRTRWSLRAHLVLLVVVSVLPVLVFSVALVVMLERQERAAVERGLRDTTRALAVALDQELLSSIRMLEALAASEHLDTGNLRAFHRLAEQSLQTRRESWATVVLFDLSGQQLLNLARPFGTPLPARRDMASHARAVRTRQPSVSDLFRGVILDRSMLSIDVPVVRGETVKYVLTASFDLDTAARVLTAERYPEEWIGEIFDRKGTIVARTRQRDHWVGTPAPADVVAASTAADDGWLRTVTKEGIPAYAAFRRTPLSGWTVALKIPVATVQASLWRSLGVVVAAGLGFLTVAVVLAFAFGERIARPIVGLSSSARGLAEGRVIEAAPSTVGEVRDLAEALSGASAERARIEATLRETNQTLEALIQASPLAIVLLDAAGVVRLWNPSAERVFGWTPEEAIGRYLPAVPAGGRLEHEANLSATLDGRVLAAVETQWRRKADTPIDVSLSTAAVRDARGRPRYVMAIAEDITDRKRRDEGRRFLAEAGEILAASLDYQSTLRNLARLSVPRIADWCAIDVVADDGSIERLALAFTNPARRRDADDLLARYPLKPDARYGVPRVIRTGEPVFRPEVSDSLLDRVVRSDEDRRLLRGLGLKSIIIVPLVARGRMLGAISLLTAESGRLYTTDDFALAQELSRRAAVAVDNARLYREAQEANRAKDEFLAVLSHELRTPLTSMLGWVRMLQTGKLDAAASVHALAVIQRNIGQQTQLITDLLDVSRIVSGKLKVDMQPVELLPVVEAAIDAVRPSCETRKVALRASLDPLSGTVWGDVERLQQVVWNLLSNAVKFTPEGGTVDVRLLREGSHARVIVRDTGKGIPARFLPHIFERFRQADSSTTRAHGGLGLGLAIVRHLVELHGGTVRADSEGEGKGAVFTVDLPLVDSTTVARPALASGATGRARRLLDGVRVLVVDDDTDTLEILALVLEQEGATVQVASSAEAAMEIFDTFAPHVVASDIAMPGETGLGLIARLRSRRADGSSIAALALTAHARAEDRDSALAAGFQAHLVKPIDPESLIDAVAALAAARSESAR